MRSVSRVDCTKSTDQAGNDNEVGQYQTMTYIRPTGLLAGFHADNPDPAIPEIVHVGEQWAPRTYPIDRHSHTVWELYLQLDGWSTWQDTTGALYRVDRGGLLVMPPGLVHWLVDREDSAKGDSVVSRKHHFLFAAVDVDTVLNDLPVMRDNWDPTNARHVVNAAEVGTPFRQLVREVSVERLYRTDALRIALKSLVLEASRVLAAQPLMIAHARMHPAVVRAKELIEHQYTRAWSLESLASITGVSANHLSVLFARDVGMPMRRYLMQVRIERSETMLRETDVSVTNLALEMGFSSSQHFATAFKQLTGMTPTDCRNGCGRSKKGED
jgi:AraC-like DNA-binding protein